MRVLPPFVIALACVAWCLTAQLVSQTRPPDRQPPTFRTEVEYVEVDVQVTDERGAIVKELRKEDFQIFEDGRPQSIAGFAFVEVPIEAVTPRPAGIVEPDVRSNERPFAGRVYVLVLDNLHTAPDRAPRVKRAAQQFIDRHLAANDLMAVVHVGGPANGSQEFTNNKRLLSAAVDRFLGMKLESATIGRNERLFGGPSPTPGAIADPFDAERGFNARSATRVLTDVADKLSSIRGRRKSIVFISEGIDYDISDVMNNRSASAILDGIREAIAAATKSNTSIYAVDPRGLTAMADAGVETSILADQRPISASSDPDTPQGTSAARPGIGTSSLRSELQLSQDSLRTLADETNGFAAVNSSDFTSAFDRIVGANTAYYVLAYYPPSNRRDGRFHRIEVRTSRPGLTIRARRGYVAPRAGNQPVRDAKNEVSPPLLRALNSAVPADGLKMRVFAAPFKGVVTSGSVVVGLELRGSDLALVDNQRVELAFVAVDSSGETRAETDAFTFKLPADTKAMVAQTSLRFLKRLNLPHGHYQLRIGAHDTASGAVGTVSYDLDVPDFTTLPFAMSGLLVMSRDATSIVTARGDAELQKFMNAPPVALRAFRKSDEVAVVAEVYDRAAATPHTVDIVTTVKSSDGQVVFTHDEKRSSADLKSAVGAYLHMVPVPLGDFPPGSYVLTVEARSRLGQSVSRHIEFAVTATP